MLYISTKLLYRLIRISCMRFLDLFSFRYWHISFCISWIWMFLFAFCLCFCSIVTLYNKGFQRLLLTFAFLLWLIYFFVRRLRMTVYFWFVKGFHLAEYSFEFVSRRVIVRPLLLIGSRGLRRFYFRWFFISLFMFILKLFLRDVGKIYLLSIKLL